MNLYLSPKTTMEVPLLPASASEYNKQKTGTRFTVRSANSPPYSLTRRLGVRKRETTEAFGERQRHRTHADTNDPNEEEDAVSGYQARTRSSRATDQSEEKDASGFQTQTTLNFNSTENKTMPDSDAYKGCDHVFARTEWRRHNLPSRSKSLDRRIGARSSAQGSILPAKGEADLSEHARDLVEKTEVNRGLSDRLTSSLHSKSAGTSYVQDRSQTLDWASRGQSLPLRFRSEFGHGSRFTENLFGSKGSQSIQERIEKLYESAGEKAAGGTFPRRFSSSESNSPVESRISLIWTQKGTPESETGLSPRTSTPGERAITGQFKSRYAEDTNWGKGGLVESGTKSLDRARSRHTLAAHIRSARAAGGINSFKTPSTFLGETFIDSSEVGEQRENGVKEESRTNQGNEKSANGVLQRNLHERMDKLKAQEKDKQTDEGAKRQTKLMSDVTDEDVFESDPQKNTLKTAERKTFLEMRSAPSATSVRNKISQFEALTQKAACQVSLPRRTFSVPTQLSKIHDGVKKSKSAKEISGQRDDREGLKGRWAEDTVLGKGKSPGSEISLSMDPIGLGFEGTETRGTYLLGESKINISDCGEYSSLKRTLQLPLNEGAQRCTRQFYTDETDFSKVSRSKESSKTDVTTSNVSSSHTSSAQPRQHLDMTSPVSDDDKTPTNSPSDSPFLSPAQPENAAFIREKKNTSGAARACKTEDLNPTPLPVAASSHSNSSDLLSAYVQTAYPKGKKQMLDLTAWIAGLNQEYDCWNANKKHYEDDDDDDDSTQLDEDSNYDSDSGDSSVTITSNISQSDRRSYSVSLTDLCNFAGVEIESNNDSDEEQLTGRRSASLSSDLSAFSCVSLLPTEALDRLLEDVKTLGDETLQDYDDVQVVVLHKEVGVGLGFSLAGGADQNKPIIVHKVFHSGVAAQEGSIKEGDHVLSINGTALSGSAHWEALKVLRKAKSQEMGVVVLRKGDVSSALKVGVEENNEETHTQYETGQRVCVQIQKNSRDLGFSLQGGVGSRDGNRPLTVQKIFQGGPVDKVYPGDQVLEIQGISTTKMRRLEAWTFIKSLPPGLVEVVLHRPNKHLQT